MKKKIIAAILLSLCIACLSLFAAGCSDNSAELEAQIDGLQQKIDELIEDMGKIEDQIDKISVDSEILEFTKVGAVCEIQNYVYEAECKNFYSADNWQKITEIESEAVESINNADNYISISAVVKNTISEIDKTETIIAAASEYSLQEAADAELISHSSLVKMADINNHFGPYNEADFKPKYSRVIKEAYGKAENLSEDDIHIDYLGEYPLLGKDGSCLACIVFPKGQGSAPEFETMIVDDVEFYFLPGCEMTIWIIEVVE